MNNGSTTQHEVGHNNDYTEKKIRCDSNKEAASDWVALQQREMTRTMKKEPGSIKELK